MKKLILILAVLALVAGAAQAVEPTATYTTTKYTTNRIGDLMIYGQVKYKLAELVADTDSTAYTTILPLSAESRLPGNMFVHVLWDSAAGATSISNLNVYMYAHVSTVAGDYITGHNVQLAAYGTTAASPAAVLTGVNVSGDRLFFPVTATYVPHTQLPPYCTFRISKTGATGKYTAGNVYIRYYVYRK
jgi:hypothetical protein